MKKLQLLLVALAAVFAVSCGSKAKEVCVDDLIAAPEKFANQQVIFGGKAFVKDAEIKLLEVYGTDTVKNIAVVADKDTRVCPKMCGKVVNVEGKVAKCDKQDGYYVAASKISVDGCNKDKECCAKGDSTKCCKKDATACPMKKGEGEKCAKADEKKCCKKDAGSCPMKDGKQAKMDKCPTDKADKNCKNKKK